MSQLSLTLLRLGFLVFYGPSSLPRSPCSEPTSTGRGSSREERGRTNTRAHAPHDDRRARPRATSVRRAAPREKAEASELRLVVVAGPLTGTVLPLDEAPITIGASPRATLVIDDDYCSSRHARVFREGDNWMVEDLGSTNGTYLDDASFDGTGGFLPERA